VGTGGVPAWSRFVRAFHWLLVTGVAGAWTTSEVGRRWHEPIGWAVVALLVLRLVWGFAGPERAARFASFVRAPGAVLAYARAVLRGSAPRYLGHNPLGGWMVVALIATLAAVSVTGWLLTTDAFWGSETMEEVHEALAIGLLALVALHVAGVVYTGRHQRENLVAAMWHGRKRAPAPLDIEA
jgi:cytochrome b